MFKLAEKSEEFGFSGSERTGVSRSDCRLVVMKITTLYELALI